jgi:hypothetical protein
MTECIQIKTASWLAPITGEYFRVGSVAACPNSVDARELAHHSGVAAIAARGGLPEPGGSCAQGCSTLYTTELIG